MKRLLIIISAISFMFAQDDPVGNWKLSGLRVDYMDIARQDAAIVLNDAYGFGISVPVAALPAGYLFNYLINGPFNNAALQGAGVNLNVNLYPDGTGVVGEGSYYPDVDLIPGQCITQGQIFPITDSFNWENSGGQEGNMFPYTNLIGMPSANGLAGQPAYGLGVNGSGVFDNWPSTPTTIPTPIVLPAITPDGVTMLALGCAGICYSGQFAGGEAECMAGCSAQPAAYGAMLPGAHGGYFRAGDDLGLSQFNADGEFSPKFILEWSAIDGMESESGLGDEIGVDEDGDGTDYDRIFGLPYISATAVNSENPLCDITGGALTGAGPGLVYPVAGDIVDALGGEAAVGELVYGSCLAGVAGGAYDSCIGQVYDGVMAQCEGAGGPVAAVTGLCYEASQTDDFAGACAYYGAAGALTATCLQLGFSEEVCSEAATQAMPAVDGYCLYTTGYDCATAGIDECAVLTDPTFSVGLCGTLAGALTESETCEEWTDSFYDYDEDEMSDTYGDIIGDSFFDANAASVLGVTCTDFAAGLNAGLAAGDPTTIATIDQLFVGAAGMSCSEYGASYVGMCVEGVVGANDMYLMDTSLETWGLFLTYNAASVQQYQAAGYDDATIAYYFPELFVNDSGTDFDPSCYYTGETCGGRLVMDFAPTCVPEVEAHQIVAEFVDLEALDCDANGDVAGGFDDLACSWNPGSALESCDCDDDNGNGALDPEEICFGDGYHDTEFEGPAGDGVVNVVDVVKMVTHIVDPMAQLGGYLFCQGDMNADGFINVVDVVNVVGIIVSPGRVGGATSTTIEYSADEINLTSNGYVGGIDILVEFANESFSFELGDNYAADWTISGNTARIVMIGDENSLEEILTVTEGEIISISNALVANSSNEVTDVTVLFDESQPLSYIIKDAYPNPFNPVTTLSVELNTTADVSVKVFNLTGQLVDVIAQGNFSPNTYNWTWNAENLASGVYFIATQIGNDMNNQKVMLIK